MTNDEANKELSIPVVVGIGPQPECQTIFHCGEFVTGNFDYAFGHILIAVLRDAADSVEARMNEVQLN